MAENTGRKSSQANTLEDVFNLLSSKDTTMSQQAKSIIIDGLINSARAGETSSWLQSYLIDYYLRTGCDNAAEILTKIQDSQARVCINSTRYSLAGLLLQCLTIGLSLVMDSTPKELLDIRNER